MSEDTEKPLTGEDAEAQPTRPDPKSRSYNQDQAEGASALRQINDDTLLDMYDNARTNEDDNCDAIAAELVWRGIEVHPCSRHPAA